MPLVSVATCLASNMWYHWHFYTAIMQSDSRALFSPPHRHKLHLSLLCTGWSIQPVQITGFSSHSHFLCFCEGHRPNSKGLPTAQHSAHICSLRGRTLNHFREAPEINRETLPLFRSGPLPNIKLIPCSSTSSWSRLSAWTSAASLWGLFQQTSLWLLYVPNGRWK